ncbi:ABC transporter ATP-binding protein [Domibacillus sp. PGB-M46]|uniref:ABC transporter ATP-binding protein n=1 Tax=Domibacillus sp. PGB-M46 TaxID=2910255 RepID=UPI001F573B95|nr:ABC transporter ATP-binding protein [Domibacillus sp. PGB-M46]MCI2254822.1 ABC transporter ATP-binding protein [Domibacillus sp. PGB-M46]
MILLELKDVCKKFNSSKGLKDINLKISPGKIHILIGENGAGKTSIIKSVLSYYPVDSGQILWKGKELFFGEFDYKKEIGYVPDDETLLEYLTPNEILNFVLNCYKVDKEKALTTAKNLMLLMDLKEGDTLVNHFSRGMRKKVQLILSLVHNPDLLVLDEPIAGLDPTMIAILKDLLKELRNKGKAIMISTHDLAIAEEIGDEISIVKDGKIILSISKQMCEQQYGSLHSLYSTVYSKEVNELRSRVHNVVSNL